MRLDHTSSRGQSALWRPWCSGGTDLQISRRWCTLLACRLFLLSHSPVVIEDRYRNRLFSVTFSSLLYYTAILYFTALPFSCTILLYAIILLFSIILLYYTRSSAKYLFWKRQKLDIFPLIFDIYSVISSLFLSLHTIKHIHELLKTFSHSNYFSHYFEGAKIILSMQLSSHLTLTASPWLLPGRNFPWTWICSGGSQSAHQAYRCPCQRLW